MHARPARAALLSLVLTSCVGFEDKPLVPQDTADSFEKRTLDDPGLGAFLREHARADTPLESWDLEELTLAALYYHPDLDVERATHAVALAGVERAAEFANPTVSLAPGFNSSSRGISPWILGAGVDVPIETAGKRGHRTARAHQLAAAARCTIASVAWQVRSRVRSALVALQGARERAAILSAQTSLEEEVVRLLEVQLAAGAVSPAEVTQARIARDRLRLERGDAERAASDALQGLARGLAVPAHALQGAQIQFAAFHATPEVPAADARRQALLNRPDLLGSLAEYAASQSELQLEVARQYPDFHIGPAFELDQGENKWSLGLSVELPVLNQNQGGIHRAEIARELAAARFVALQARVIGEVERAVANYGAALDRIQALESQRRELQEQVSRARAMADLGETDRLTLFGAQLELGVNSLDRLEAASQVQQVLGRLEDAMQSPAVLPESLWAAVPDRRPD